MIKLNLFNDKVANYLQANPKIRLTETSGIAKWNSLYKEKQIDLNTLNGAIFLFLTALLYNYGGGGKGRNAQLLKLYPIIYTKNFHRSTAFKLLNPVIKAQIFAVVNFLQTKEKEFGENVLKGWWLSEKKKAKGNLELAAINILVEIQTIKFASGRVNRDGEQIMQHAFTSKAFLIARELHANKIWKDFPLKYCYVPDVKMVQELVRRKFKSEWFHLFLISEFLHNEIHDPTLQALYDWPLLK